MLATHANSMLHGTNRTQLQTQEDTHTVERKLWLETLKILPLFFFSLRSSSIAILRKREKDSDLEIQALTLHR